MNYLLSALRWLLRLLQDAPLERNRDGRHRSLERRAVIPHFRVSKQGKFRAHLNFTNFKTIIFLQLKMLRVSKECETVGLDIYKHDEEAYPECMKNCRKTFLENNINCWLGFFLSQLRTLSATSRSCGRPPPRARGAALCWRRAPRPQWSLP